MPAQDRTSIRFPNHENYEAALYADGGRWVGEVWRPEIHEIISAAIVRLSNPKHTPGQVMQELRSATEILAMAALFSKLTGTEITPQDMQQMQVEVIDLSGESEDCGNPDCPVHGQRAKGERGGLDNAFGMEDWQL